MFFQKKNNGKSKTEKHEVLPKNCDSESFFQQVILYFPISNYHRREKTIPAIHTEKTQQTERKERLENRILLNCDFQ